MEKSVLTLGEVVTDLAKIHLDPVWKVLSSAEFHGQPDSTTQAYLITKSGRTFRIKIDEL